MAPELVLSGNEQENRSPTLEPDRVKGMETLIARSSSMIATLPFRAAYGSCGHQLRAFPVNPVDAASAELRTPRLLSATSTQVNSGGPGAFGAERDKGFQIWE